MNFEIINPEGKIVMHTEYTECIPYDLLSYMYKAGFRFKINSKSYSVDKINQEYPNPEHDKHILCTTTGKRFYTQAEAARFYGIDSAQVSDSIKTGKARSGYTFVKD